MSTLAIPLESAAAADVPHAGYRPDIDGLRAVAVLSVLGFHAFPNLVPGGFVGVDVFFVISGFLISGIVMGELGRGHFSLASFYARRVRRIFTALIVVLACTYAAGWMLLVAGDFRDLGKHIAGGAGFVANLVQWRESGYFAADAELQPLLHLWSLGIEEQFYLAWPLLLWLAWRRSLGLLALIAVIVAASFAFDVSLLKTDAVASFYSPLGRVWELLLGAALAWRAQNGMKPVQHPGTLATAGLVLIGAAILLVDKQHRFPGWWALLPTIGTVLVIRAGKDAVPNRFLLSHPAVVWVGLISYPLYLWHWPLLAFERIETDGMPSSLLRLGALAAAVVLASLTYLYIERPVRRQGIRKTVFALSLGMGCLGAVGLDTYWSRGMTERTANHDERRQFMHYYEHMGRELAGPYHLECDFYDSERHGRKASIDASCVNPGGEETVFLWGDSHAQALSHGIRSLMPREDRVAQVATAGCKPHLGPTDTLTPGDACNASNAFALAAIERLKPAVVVMAQIDRHLATDWDAIAEVLLHRGVGKVLLVGPVPRWDPSLPSIVAHLHWGKPHDRLRDGLERDPIETDRLLASRYGTSKHLRYVSMVAGLCNQEGCMATIPEKAGPNLLAWDSGHLTPDASVFVVEKLLRAPIVSAAMAAAPSHAGN